jgi:hypothetical protein
MQLIPGMDHFRQCAPVQVVPNIMSIASTAGVIGSQTIQQGLCDAAQSNDA